MDNSTKGIVESMARELKVSPAELRECFQNEQVFLDRYGNLTIKKRASIH